MSLLDFINESQINESFIPTTIDELKEKIGNEDLVDSLLEIADMNIDFIKINDRSADVKFSRNFICSKYGCSSDNLEVFFKRLPEELKDYRVNIKKNNADVIYDGGKKINISVGEGSKQAGGRAAKGLSAEVEFVEYIKSLLESDTKPDEIEGDFKDLYKELYKNKEQVLEEIESGKVLTGKANTLLNKDGHIIDKKTFKVNKKVPELGATLADVTFLDKIYLSLKLKSSQLQAPIINVIEPNYYGILSGKIPDEVDDFFKMLNIDVWKMSEAYNTGNLSKFDLTYEENYKSKEFTQFLENLISYDYWYIKFEGGKIYKCMYVPKQNLQDVIIEKTEFAKGDKGRTINLYCKIGSKKFNCIYRTSSSSDKYPKRFFICIGLDKLLQ